MIFLLAVFLLLATVSLPSCVNLHALVILVLLYFEHYMLDILDIHTSFCQHGHVEQESWLHINTVYSLKICKMSAIRLQGYIDKNKNYIKI